MHVTKVVENDQGETAGGGRSMIGEFLMLALMVAVEALKKRPEDRIVG